MVCFACRGQRNFKSCKFDSVCDGATLYVTLSPCRECSKLIHQSGISRVVYSEAYKDLSGVEFLKKAGVIVNQILKVIK